MGARPYDPVLGRFYAPDPVECDAPNSYDYADQDPINFHDITGLGKGRPRSNVAQNKQFGAAARECARRLGRDGDKLDERELEKFRREVEELDDPNMGFQELVEVCLGMGFPSRAKGPKASRGGGGGGRVGGGAGGWIGAGGARWEVM
jgi:hypothetical protein